MADFQHLANPLLDRPDAIVLQHLIRDATRGPKPAANGNGKANGMTNGKAANGLKAVNGKSNGSVTTTATATEPAPSSVLDDVDASIELLNSINDPKSAQYEQTVFTTVGFDPKDTSFISRCFVQPYARWAVTVVRRDTDVVFLTHTLIYLCTLVPSAVFLYWRFSMLHGIAHWLATAVCAGPFTLMLHNHIHCNGVLAPAWKWFDWTFPYVLEPLLGHTWDSYYFHHVKHHHIEGNGPEDLSSTVRYQRDEILHFLHYLFRFMLLVWIELPIYFIGKGRKSLAIRTFLSEVGSYTFFYFMARWQFYPTLFVFLLPLVQMRTAMMVGNWGQHAFVDDVEPESAFRSSITLIDVTSNRYCFNDGYHTSHHLNPRRHWRDHPVSLLKAKDQYSDGRALIFADIDYFMITMRLMMKDYDYLADHLVPIGEQIAMTKKERADLLRTKTRRFTEEDIKRKFKGE